MHLALGQPICSIWLKIRCITRHGHKHQESQGCRDWSRGTAMRMRPAWATVWESVYSLHLPKQKPCVMTVKHCEHWKLLMLSLPVWKPWNPGAFTQAIFSTLTPSASHPSSSRLLAVARIWSTGTWHPRGGDTKVMSPIRRQTLPQLPTLLVLFKVALKGNSQPAFE